MQFQADILGCTIKRPKFLETTALGAAYLAGLAVGYWKDMEEIRSLWEEGNSFEPDMPNKQVDKNLHFWHKAVQRSTSWLES